ncbi:MAG: AI-2E family transporter [bacterium]|nr:AI-2E family transporter [bacterium]
MVSQYGSLDITWPTIFKLALAAFGLYVIFLIKDILVWVLFALVISVVFDPVIDFLCKRRIPRTLAAVLVYSMLFAFLAFTIYSSAPFFLKEIQRFSALFPQYFETLAPPLQGIGITAFSDFQSFLDAVGGSIQQLGSSAVSGLSTVFGGLFSMIFVISIAIFLSIEEKSVDRAISLLFPKKYEAVALKVWGRSQRQVAGWFLTRLFSSAFVGVATYIALVILNVPYPFSLSLFSGVLNLIPIVGPLLTGVLIGGVVALDSIPKAIFVLLSFILIQQIEGNVLTPLLTNRFVGLPPALVLISLAIGGQLWGVMGAILAIPLAGILYEFLRDFLKRRREEEAKAAPV